LRISFHAGEGPRPTARCAPGALERDRYFAVVSLGGEMELMAANLDIAETAALAEKWGRFAETRKPPDGGCHPGALAAYLKCPSVKQ
jgi:hypothetical protein